jgi:chromosome segregation ATPase
MRGSEINRPSDARSDRTDEKAEPRTRGRGIFGGRTSRSESSASNETSSSRHARRTGPSEVIDVDAITISSGEDSPPRNARRPESLELVEVITIPSSEESSPRSVYESRSPEREESPTMNQLLRRMRRAVEREKKTMEEEKQRLQQDLNRTREQLTKAQQERDQAQGQLKSAQQDLDRTREQLTKAQQEQNRTQEQLKQYEGAQLSRANNTFPPTKEGMQQQLEGIQKIQQESRERVLQLREHVQRAVQEKGDNHLKEVLEKHRLIEEIYPNQPSSETLRQTLKDLYLLTLVEGVSSGRRADQITEEFAEQLRQCSEAASTEDVG